MELKTFKNKKISFKYPVTWEKEQPDTFNNPDCIATLSKGDENLLNVVMFPTHANLEEFKLKMEDMITDDGGVLMESDLVSRAGKDAIKVVAEMSTPDIVFEIYTYVFIYLNNIYIFELRTVNPRNDLLDEYDALINSFEIL
ncbi:MAG: hypothetical protein Q4P18_04805 [Methanobrevibacter sp.]|uniref:hypothetical protein n=1 Tax=Methanobrevibacter sp. TaxID=66852 RepID=UPI0026DF5C9B|nr:hypothetical protein [Methanobrevibacter sp.]MDO5848831.1 hypothetical protein [Methanobrevibacter sp.]